MDSIVTFNAKYTKKTPDLKSGDTVRVHTKIQEGNKERVQIFEGVVIKTQGGKDIGATATVRKMSYGIGVERTFLIHSPLIEKIQVVKRAKVRRANIGYLRNLKGKSAKLKDKQFDVLAVNVKEEDLAPADKVVEEPVEEVAAQPEDTVEAEVEETKEGKTGEASDEVTAEVKKEEPEEVADKEVEKTEESEGETEKK